MRHAQNGNSCLRRSNLEPRGPRKRPQTRPRSSRGVHYARLFAQISNPPTKTVIEGVRGRELAK
eukprot:1133187-Alexandrium_andersonii.AAC.1